MIQGEAMVETDKLEGESVAPPTVPIRGINQPDPTTGSESESKEPIDGPTGHEAFEKAKAETQRRE